jgi:hypothetical protein
MIWLLLITLLFVGGAAVSEDVDSENCGFFSSWGETAISLLEQSFP